MSYVEVFEAVARVYKRHGISTAMRPYTTIRSLLVYPKDTVSKEKTAECVYRIPCKKITASKSTLERRVVVLE